MSLIKQIKAFLLLTVLLFAFGHNAFPHVHHQHALSSNKVHEVHHHSHGHNQQHERHQHGKHQHEDRSQDWQDLNFLQVLLVEHSSTNHTHQYTLELIKPFKLKKQPDQKLIHYFEQVEILISNIEVDLRQGFNALICPYDSGHVTTNPLRGPPFKV